MSFKTSNELAQALLQPTKTQLDGGFVTIYSGSVPAAPDDALDMANDHTQLAVLSVDGDGVTGLTFAEATGAVIAKTNAETWEGTVAFTGAEDGQTTLTPTFFRFCPAGDTGQDDGTGPRLQGTAGGPASVADMKLGSDTLTANGSNTVGVSLFNVRLSSLG